MPFLAEPVLAVTEKLIVPFPVPDGLLTVIHGTLLIAAQPQPEAVVIFTLLVPPPTGAL